MRVMRNSQCIYVFGTLLVMHKWLTLKLNFYRSGNIDIHEFSALWKYIQEWKNCFDRYHLLPSCILSDSLDSLFNPYGVVHVILQEKNKLEKTTCCDEYLLHFHISPE